MNHSLQKRVLKVEEFHTQRFKPIVRGLDLSRFLTGHLSIEFVVKTHHQISDLG